MSLETPLATLLSPGAPTSAPPLRPMSLGEVIDRALQLFRANFSRLLVVMLAFQVPMYVLSKAFQIVIQKKAPVLARPGAFRGLLPDAGQVAWFTGAILVMVIGSLVIYQLAVAALTTAAARAFLGEKIEAGRALREGLSRAPQLLATFFLLLTWSAFLLTLSIIPGVGLMAAGLLSDELRLPPALRATLIIGGLVLALALLVIVGLYLLLRYALVSEVVVIEKLSLRRALQRSTRLMAGRVGKTAIDNCKIRASILYAVNFCISVSVLVVTSIPTLVVNGIYGVSPFDPERYDPAMVPLWASVPVEVLGVFAQSAVAPFGLLAVIVFYFDIRMKREGFDLELLAGRIGGPR